MISENTRIYTNEGEFGRGEVGIRFKKNCGENKEFYFLIYNKKISFILYINMYNLTGKSKCLIHIGVIHLST